MHGGETQGDDRAKPWKQEEKKAQRKMMCIALEHALDRLVLDLPSSRSVEESMLGEVTRPRSEVEAVRESLPSSLAKPLRAGVPV